jgi:starvation-inducible outer membrane lipoprotein
MKLRQMSHPALQRSPAAVSLAAALALSACTSSLETPQAMMPTGKYNFYSCDQIANEAQQTGRREMELRQAMAKAAAGPGAEFVNAVAYKAEFLTVQGELKEMENAAAAKKCKQRIRADSDSVVR